MNFWRFGGEVAVWHVEHFGASVPAWKPMLKAQEELGEASRAVNLGDTASLADEIADTIIALAAVCSRSGISLNDAVEKRWAEIRERSHDRVKENFRRPVLATPPPSEDRG